MFFRAYSPKKELTRRAGFAALLSRGSYDKVDSKIFLFDNDTDCFAWDGYLFIHNVGAFQRIFGYFEELRANANATIDAVLGQIPVNNPAVVLPRKRNEAAVRRAGSHNQSFPLTRLLRQRMCT